MAVRKVPQWPLAGHGLVDARQVDTVRGSDGAAKGLIRSRDETAFDVEFARRQDDGEVIGRQGAILAHERRRYPFARGHTCPAGSSGWVQNGQGGLPAPATIWARAANDRA